ncbi:uncharacterized protein LOC114542544 [Dendronephthya gigantea]|uniref:uncharacterized protein LOC114542544 n=1 Tax=Dendronephthya gigantea TaxID=151771 RepID=UPI00106AB4B2|nr:uncharacterized protein LOC114542544 [Dendronephthya gigantea]
MAVGSLIFSSRAICLILYLYLILGDLTCTKSTCKLSLKNGAVLTCSMEAPVVKIPCVSRCRRSTVKTQPLSIRRKVAVGTQILVQASIATLLLQLSGDIHCNPGPIDMTKSNKRCLSFNARSLCSTNKLSDGTIINNLRSFQNMVYAENLDLVAVTETWLKDSISDKEILPYGYHILRKDRATNMRGGGVLLALRNDIEYNQITSEHWSELEIVAAEFLDNAGTKCLVSICYRPPNCNLAAWLDLFTKFLQLTECYDKVLITGDFNFPELTWESNLVSNSTELTSASAVEFRELIYDFYLQQTNTHPMRLANILDLIITNCPETISDISCISPIDMDMFSDHKLLFFDFCLHTKATCLDSRKVFNYRLADWEGLFEKLSQIDITSNVVLTGDSGASDGDARNHASAYNVTTENIDEIWRCWNELFLKAVTQYIPTKTIRRRNTPPWFDSELKHLINKKETARRKAKITGKTQHVEKYRLLRRLTKKLISKKRYDFYQTLPNVLKRNPKRFWSVFKTVSNSSSVPNKLYWSHDDITSTAETPTDIANLLNTYFNSMFKSPLTNEQYEHYTVDVELCEALDEILISPDEVEAVLQSLDTEKA